MPESDIVRACLHYLLLRGVLSWRSNNVGVYNAKTGGYFFHGMRGVSDVLGILPQTVTLKDGSEATFGNLLAIEVKMPGKSPTNEQRAFLKAVNDKGGVGICVHSIDELAAELDRFI